MRLDTKLMFVSSIRSSKNMACEPLPQERLRELKVTLLGEVPAADRPAESQQVGCYCTLTTGKTQSQIGSVCLCVCVWGRSRGPACGSPRVGAERVK